VISLRSQLYGQAGVVFYVGCYGCCPGLLESGTDRGAERLGHRWREGISDLAVGGRLAASDSPARRHRKFVSTG
jgi:hypothetical protein